MPRISEALASEWVEYIPDVGDNRIDSDPLTVEVRPMSVADVKAFQRQHGPRLSKDGGASIKYAQQLAESIIRERVRNVRGYVHLGVSIDSGHDLAEYGESEVCDDVFAAILKMSHLREGLKKKSDSPSDFTQAATRPLGGAAGE